MQDWFSVSLGDGVLAFEPKEALRTRFAECFAVGPPTDAAIFTRHELEGRLQCEVIAYFAPGAAALAREAGARPCARPGTQDLDLLAGDPACCTTLFPDAG